MIALKKEIRDINERSDKKEDKTWIEVKVESSSPESLEGVKYEMILPDGTKKEGQVQAGNVIREDGIDKKDVKFRLVEEK